MKIILIIGVILSLTDAAFALNICNFPVELKDEVVKHPYACSDVPDSELAKIESIVLRGQVDFENGDQPIPFAVTKDQLGVLPNLESIEFRSYLAKKEVLPSDLLVNNPNVKSIDFVQNEFIIPIDFFQPVPMLQELRVYSTRLETNGSVDSQLRCETFKGLHLLRNLAITSTNIRGIPHQCFSELHTLKRLDLSNNRIGHIFSLFIGLNPDIEYVNLSGNKIFRTHVGLQNFTKLEILNLSNTGLYEVGNSVIPRSDSLKVVYLRKNQIEKFSREALVGVKGQVRLEKNYLTEENKKSLKAEFPDILTVD